MCGLNSLRKKIYVALGCFLMFTLCCGCQSSHRLNMPELQVLKKELKTNFPAVTNMKATYGKKSKDVSIFVETGEITEEDIFGIVMAVREVFIDKSFQENLFDEIGTVSRGPEVSLWFQKDGEVSSYSFVSRFQDDATGEYRGYKIWGGGQWPFDPERYREISWKEICEKATQLK